MSSQNEMPHEEGLDHSLGLLKDGYEFILKRREELNSNVFETRLLGLKVICMGGKEAAEIFYDTEKFQRTNAAPNRIKQTLFGENSIQTLDGGEHKQRKKMFMSMLSGERLTELRKAIDVEWIYAIEKWERMGRVVLYEEVQELLCRAAYKWAGIPVNDEEVEQLTKDLAAMFESAAKAGPKHWQGRHARNRVEQFIEKVVTEVRNGNITPPVQSILYQFSKHKDNQGEMLEPLTVAVEIINVLRPIVAISVYITFVVLALHEHPGEKEKVLKGDEKYIDMFVEEVRRFYPFFPFAAALVRKDFTWKGYKFKEGTLTMLDLYGTNHDLKIWDNPYHFNPLRFEKREENHYDFIPQGGGEYETGHRCPGEKATFEIMKVSLQYLVNHMDFIIPAQDLTYNLISMPTIPSSGIILEDVKRK